MTRDEYRKVKNMNRESLEELFTLKHDTGFIDGQAQMITLFMAFLRIDKHHTGNYLKKFLHEFSAFAVSVNGYGPGEMEELKRILLDECDFDIGKEFRKLVEEYRRGGNDSRNA